MNVPIAAVKTTKEHSRKGIRMMSINNAEKRL
jgi:hypothetical protein